MQTLTLTGVDGSTWPLIAPGVEPTGPWIPEEGVEGLVARGRDLAVESLRAGQRFSGVKVEPLEGKLTVACRARLGETERDTYAAFRRAWSRTTPATLTAAAGGHTFSIEVRLADWIGEPPADPDGGADMEMSIEVVADDGVWWRDPSTGTGTVTVTNHGIVHVSPEIRWSGAGGRVNLPSGASFTLPAVSGQRRLLLDPDESLVVLTSTGAIDRGVWDQVAKSALPEGIAPGRTATFTVPDGAQLWWREGVDAPW